MDLRWYVAYENNGVVAFHEVHNSFRDTSNNDPWVVAADDAGLMLLDRDELLAYPGATFGPLLNGTYHPTPLPSLGIKNYGVILLHLPKAS